MNLIGRLDLIEHGPQRPSLPKSNSCDVTNRSMCEERLPGYAHALCRASASQMLRRCPSDFVMYAMKSDPPSFADEGSSPLIVMVLCATCASPPNIVVINCAELPPPVPQITVEVSLSPASKTGVPEARSLERSLRGAKVRPPSTD